MKLKYYMRGLGIGIILTTLIFIISGNKVKLTDKEIIARATDLGMVMQDKQNAVDVLDDIQDGSSDQNPTGTPEPTTADEPSASPEPTDSADLSGTPEPTVTSEPDVTQEPNITPDPADTPVPTVTLKPTLPPKPTVMPTKAPSQESDPEDQPTDNGETGEENDTPVVEERMDIVFTIVRGMSSGKVAKLLQEIGLVDDADKFNEYIVKEGKADVIRVGTFTVSKGSSYEEIINAITD